MLFGSTELIFIPLALRCWAISVLLIGRWWAANSSLAASGIEGRDRGICVARFALLSSWNSGVRFMLRSRALLRIFCEFRVFMQFCELPALTGTPRWVGTILVKMGQVTFPPDFAPVRVTADFSSHRLYVTTST